MTKEFHHNTRFYGTVLDRAGNAGERYQELVLNGAKDAVEWRTKVIKDVVEYGAKGDGTTDDTAAIKAAITAAGDGGTVFFPRGEYLVSSPLAPTRGQKWIGEHTPKYAIDATKSSCVIKAKAGFTGASLIERVNDALGITLESLCFEGLGHSTGAQLDGIHLGTTSGSEQGWMISDCSVHNFNGYGITGRMQVVNIRDSHFANNRVGIGFRADPNQGANDSQWSGLYVYYNLEAGISLAGGKKSAGLVISNSRIERSGGDPSNVRTPLNADAPGLYIKNATNVRIIGCDTDANTGAGLKIDGNNANAAFIEVVGCDFMRDGGGNQSIGTQKSAIELLHCQHINITACSVIEAPADDTGTGTGLKSPYHLVTMDHTEFCVINGIAADLEGVGADDTAKEQSKRDRAVVVTNDWMSHITLERYNYQSGLYINNSEAPPAKTVGSWYFNESGGTYYAKFWDGSAWQAVGGGGAATTHNYQTTVQGPGLHTITHSLGTKWVNVSVYDAAGNEISAEVQLTGTGTLTVKAPSVGGNDNLDVVVIA